ncbi:MAG: 2-oxoglutarate dehydrogenase complex dihydrolipoyllysine-residue succinyltransferase, partial [Proteobacteria bacterium]|nr:2-oxoglutarate dehydrogenase complex dihydrolipoyllysine-residue succinyltransferase [Pseudomonadota bacterium]
AQAAPAAQAQAKATAPTVNADGPAAELIQPEAPPRPLSPAVRRIIDETDVDPSRVAGTGKAGRITKGDVQQYLERGDVTPAVAKPPAEARAPDERGEERARMSRLRRLVAQRLKEAQNTAAMLTTFNEVDMGAVMAIRADYRDSFEKKHRVKLGFMSFFVKAAIVALKDFPAVNAEIQGDEIVYKNYYDIGIAVSTESGLVVPVLRNADALGFADIEKKIGDFGRRARDGKLAMDELQGGTFTVTNGGVFGSLLSTPILNPPQSGILGMHKIQQRPMVDDGGAIVARPMMYLALSYDHRIVDGREAVSFLVRIKECVEDPRRVLFDL